MKLILENWRKYLNEEERRKVNIFLDMDGVLVDFPSALKEYIKKVYHTDPHEIHPDSKSSRRALRKLQQLQLDDQEIDSLYDKAEHKFQSGNPYEIKEKLMSTYTLKALLNNQDLWLSMEQLSGAATLVDIAFDLADEVFVLTAHVDEASKIAKKKWIHSHFPQISNDRVHVDRQKGVRLLRLIEKGVVGKDDINILIDDRHKFLNDFIAAGGIGIQYSSESPSNAIRELERLLATI